MLLSEEKYVKTTVHIKTEHFISAGRVINIDTFSWQRFFLQNYQIHGFRQTYRNKALDNLLGNPGISKLYGFILEFC